MLGGCSQAENVGEESGTSSIYTHQAEASTSSAQAAILTLWRTLDTLGNACTTRVLPQWKSG